PPAMASPLAGGMPAAAPASFGGMAPGGAPPAPKAKKADAPRQRAREQSKGGGGILSRLLGRGSSGERTEATPTAMDAYAGDDGFAMFDKAESAAMPPMEALFDAECDDEAGEGSSSD